MTDDTRSSSAQPESSEPPAPTLPDPKMPPASPTPPAAPTPPAPAAPLPPGDDSDRKDRLVQTRVPRDLERRVKGEARRRRLSVSQFVRTLLEDALELVDDVLVNVDEIVADSVDFADHVRRDAQSLARTASREGRRMAEAVRGQREERAAALPESNPDRDIASGDRLASVVAWNAVILNRSTRCAQCEAELVRGERAHLGMDERPGHAPAFLCGRCMDEL